MKKTLTSLFLSCVFTTPILSHAEVYTRAFAAKKKDVWKATLITLSKYPLDKNNQESGEIVTSKIGDSEIYKVPNSKQKHHQEYKIFINLESRRYKGRKITLVKLEKKIIRKGDFILADKEVESDSIEEQVLLYRISREIKIDRSVSKLFK